MRSQAFKLLIIFLLAPLTISITLSFAQDVCPQIVQQALSDLGPNCESLERNAACYGYNRVGATFTETQPDDFFSAVSDRTPLNILDTLETTPLDAEAGTWGVAVMKVQANVPNSLPGQAVTFILFGDAEVRNEVPTTEAFTPAEPIDVITTGNVNVRSNPSTNANVVGSVAGGTTMTADGQSENGEWLRVVFNNAPGWVSAGLVIAPPEAANLPALTESLRTPMQAFHVTTSFNQAGCQEAPDVLLVQGPDNMKVNLTVNGAEVEIGSTIAIRSGQQPFSSFANNPTFTAQFGSQMSGLDLPDDMVCNQTQIMVIDGEADIDDDSGYELPAGFTAFSVNCGGAELVSGFQSPWYGARPLTPDELAFLGALDGLNATFLNYPIDVPTFEDIQTLVQALAGAGAGNSSGASNGPAANLVDCSTLRPTSPLGTMPGNNVPFYWDAAAGATSYTVRVYDSSGGQVGEFSTNAPQTSLVGNPGGKENMAWDVSAYVNGELACTSARVGVLRDTVYDAPAPVTQSSSYFICLPFDPYFPPTCPAGCTTAGSCGYLNMDTLCQC